MHRLRLLPALLVIAAPLAAQTLVPQADVAKVSGIIDSNLKRNSLQCDFERSGPALDYDLRYAFSFFIKTTAGQLKPGDHATVYIRVTPQGRPAVYLSQAFNVPTVPVGNAPTARDIDTRHLTGDAEFEIGEGKYATDVLLLDQQGRSCHQHWAVGTGKYTGPFPTPLRPLTVRVARVATWNGKLDPKGIRLSVLLDAMPLNPNSQEFKRAGRAEYMDSLTTILRNVPARSVSLEAFVLGKQDEIFRQKDFDGEGFVKLGEALQKLEYSTVPYQSLKTGTEEQYLAHLVDEQTSAEEPFDAVIFLGANTPNNESPPQSQLPPTTATRFFYFEFYPLGQTSEYYICPRGDLGSMWCETTPHSDAPGEHVGFRFADSIESLTKALHGSVFVMLYPKDLVSGIQKVRENIKTRQGGTNVPPGGSP